MYVGTCVLDVTAPVLTAPTRIGAHSVVTLGCEGGMTPISGGTLVCREDGTWQGELPVCGSEQIDACFAIIYNVVHQIQYAYVIGTYNYI